MRFRAQPPRMFILDVKPRSLDSMQLESASEYGQSSVRSGPSLELPTWYSGTKVQIIVNDNQQMSKLINHGLGSFRKGSAYKILCLSSNAVPVWEWEGPVTCRPQGEIGLDHARLRPIVGRLVVPPRYVSAARIPFSTKVAHVSTPVDTVPATGRLEPRNLEEVESGQKGVRNGLRVFGHPPNTVRPRVKVAVLVTLTKA
ncbi:cmgc cdk cdk9 protein kinase [Moniliophthora roreri]|nr:cmgc cdk cdk9 protein kinase [Moniliophthora roreri]